jgi:protein SCO1/2
MTTKYSNKKVAAFAALVVLPALGIFFFARLNWVHKKLPYYFMEAPLEGKDSIPQTVSDIVLYNQHGQQIGLDDFDSCIVLVNIFFASCPEVCPEMNKQLQTVAEKYGNLPQIRFLTVTIDPERDSIPVLKAYADRFNADLYKRTFATGSKREIYDWAINDLHLATEQTPDDDFIHDDKVVIMDKERHIRAVLPTRGETNTERMNHIKRIFDDIDNLLYEYRKQNMDQR